MAVVVDPEAFTTKTAALDQVIGEANTRAGIHPYITIRVGLTDCNRTVINIDIIAGIEVQTIQIQGYMTETAPVHFSEGDVAPRDYSATIWRTTDMH